ncbi:MAG: META domain-containing protein [Verrucomicrobiota bacterium]|jgi:heat shock protein HslJ|nr:META domain-containing protein [Verrucomicrobiota bacterium]MDP7049860.1 META domain-containing protein [Verrucomicrobiota bacterium]
MSESPTDLHQARKALGHPKTGLKLCQWKLKLVRVVLKFHFTDLACEAVCLLALALAAPALGQEASRIHSLEAAPVSLGFSSSDGDYHLVQASWNLQKWVTVGQYPGNGKPAKFNDLRGQLGKAHFYRVVTSSQPFPDGLLDREWKLIAFHEADEIIRPKTGRKHTLNLDRNGKITGWNDCNRYFGSFKLEKGNWLKFGKGFGSTLMLCMPGSLDFEFFKSLQSSKGFEVDGKKLKLHYGENAEHWMEFMEND